MTGRLGTTLRTTLRTHWLMASFLVAGLVMRVLVDIAYWPALLFYGDSYAYLRDAQRLAPQTAHPIGYPVLLKVLSISGAIGVVPIVQHLLGLALGLVIYLLVLRFGVRRPLAAIAALPVLLGGFQLDIEQFVLAETLTDVALLAGMAVLLWRRRLGTRQAAIVGLLLAAATLTRTAAFAVVAVVGLYLLVRRHWRAAGAYAVAVAVALGAYAAWDAASNSGSASGMSGYFLYGRVAPFATCDYPLPGRLRQLCPTAPVSTRSRNPEVYVWERASPLAAPGLGTRAQRNALALHFSEQVIRHQPLAYAEAAAADTWHYFTPGRWMSPRTDSVDVRRWQFPGPGLQPERNELHVFFANAGFGRRPITPSPDFALTGFLRSYQSVLYLPGPALLAALVGAGLVGLGLTGLGSTGFGLSRRRGSRGDRSRADGSRRGAGSRQGDRSRAATSGPVRRSRARWAALVLAASGLVLVAVPSLITGFSYRYGLPLLILLPPAGMIAADIGTDALLGDTSAGPTSTGSPTTRRSPPPAVKALDASSPAGDGYSLRDDRRPRDDRR
ncbi:MAG: hypothetical protein ACRD0J_06550, partial [Acidimicrobiales bacterium]